MTWLAGDVDLKSANFNIYIQFEVPEFLHEEIKASGETVPVGEKENAKVLFVFCFSTL